MTGEITALINVGTLSEIMLSLIWFIGASVTSFSYRYMKGDKHYKTFFVNLFLLMICISLTVTANNLILLYISLCLSNILTVNLMIHNINWKAAQYSGLITAKQYIFAVICVGISFILLFNETKTLNIREISFQAQSYHVQPLILFLLLIGAMIQSAIWPFHKWLISSLNAPTNVSAMMHAGLVNGGGFLLARFAPLYLKQTYTLNFIFIVGIITALLGTLWKLMQHDIKRMLACSTMAQMGFMFMQCGLGCFPLAVSHLFYHGLFKSYIFLSAGGSATEKRFDLGYTLNLKSCVSILLGGIVGSISFMYITNIPLVPLNGYLVIVTIIFMSCAQFSLTLINLRSEINIVCILPASFFISAIYALNTEIFLLLLEPLNIMHPISLNFIHVIGIALLAITWAAVGLYKSANCKSLVMNHFILNAYVKILNASQPHPQTVTANRNQYSFK